MRHRETIRKGSSEVTNGSNKQQNTLQDMTGNDLFFFLKIEKFQLCCLLVFVFILIIILHSRLTQFVGQICIYSIFFDVRQVCCRTPKKCAQKLDAPEK